MLTSVSSTVTAFCVAGAAGLVLAQPAQAADGPGASLVVPEAASSSQVEVRGTCPSGSRTAVLRLYQSRKLLDRQETAVDRASEFSALLSMRGASEGRATVTLECFGSTGDRPVGTASADFTVYSENAPYPMPGQPTGPSAEQSAEQSRKAKATNADAGERRRAQRADGWRLLRVWWAGSRVVGLHGTRHSLTLR